MSISATNNLMIGIYFHPEAYPPTLNAIGELSECFGKIAVVHRPHQKTEWEFPSNVEAIPSGRAMSSIDQERASLKDKIAFFLAFTRSLLSTFRKNKPAVILVYDSISLLAYRIIRPLIGSNHLLWYHNHDVAEWQLLRKYSIGWFAGRAEKGLFPKLDIFSLPSDERRKYFPMDKFRGRYFFIPNYPAKKFYRQFYQEKKLSVPLRLIFQGSIGPYHGIEQIIPFLDQPIEGYSLELVLKGPCREEDKATYLALAEKHGVSDKLVFAGLTRYADVPKTAADCHIGIGILAKEDVMNTTLGTASNKLYEYAAVGLPVIYYNSPNFAPFLEKYPWAVASSLDAKDIREAIRIIISSYEVLSVKAHEDFEKSLNFESVFKQVKEYFINNKVPGTLEFSIPHSQSPVKDL